jgi:hypothetical protein
MLLIFGNFGISRVAVDFSNFVAVQIFFNVFSKKFHIFFKDRR